MTYELTNEIEIAQAETRFKYLIKKGKKIELKEIKHKRSISQNSYLHLILSAFGLEFGYNTQEVKQYIFKEIVNPEIFNNGEKHGIVKIQSWRSTAELDTLELTTAISRFLDYSANNGYLLPDPSNLSHIQQLENEINNAKQWI